MRITVFGVDLRDEFLEQRIGGRAGRDQDAEQRADPVVCRRGPAGVCHALSALLAVLDGASSYDEVLTVATTNDPKALDSAATRSARFDSIIEIGYRQLPLAAEGSAQDFKLSAAKLFPRGMVRRTMCHGHPPW